MRYFILLLIISMVSCVCTKKEKSQDTLDFKPVYKPGPSVIVYKTKINYNELVPVFLNDEKTKIIAYPYPKDLKVDDVLTLPTELRDGYLLDNRGIYSNVAFINITYQKYSELNELPDIDSLYKLIVDKNPLLELYDCGLKSEFQNIEEQLNEIIEHKKLDKIFKRLK